MQDGPVTRLVLIRRQIQSMDCSLSPSSLVPVCSHIHFLLVPMEMHYCLQILVVAEGERMVEMEEALCLSMQRSCQ